MELSLPVCVSLPIPARLLSQLVFYRTYSTLRGLGLLKGGICPHYSSEPLRQASLKTAVRENTMPISYAVDDGAAMVFGPKTVIDLCSAAPGAGCYQISNGQETAHQTRPVSLGERHLGLLD